MALQNQFLNIIEPNSLNNEFAEENPLDFQLSNGDFVGFAHEGRVYELGIIVDMVCKPGSQQILKLTIFVGYEYDLDEESNHLVMTNKKMYVILNTSYTNSHLSLFVYLLLLTLIVDSNILILNIFDFQILNYIFAHQNYCSQMGTIIVIND